MPKEAQQTQIPTASTLTYLFADRIAPKDKAMTQGAKVPCTEVKVQKKALAQTMFAVAFMRLRDQGQITLDIEEKGFLFFKWKKTKLRRTGSEGRPGLEGAVMETASEEDGVRQVVWRWFGQDMRDPWRHVINQAIAEAGAMGYLKEVDAQRGKVAGFLLGKTDFQPDCDRIASLEGQFEEFAARWREFQQAEPQVYDEVMTECSKAIASRLESDDDRDWD